MIAVCLGAQLKIKAPFAQRAGGQALGHLIDDDDG
jgi:hypothetical protein